MADSGLSGGLLPAGAGASAIWVDHSAKSQPVPFQAVEFQAAPIQPTQPTFHAAQTLQTGRNGSEVDDPAFAQRGSASSLAEPRWSARRALALIVMLSLTLWAMIVALVALI